jgi:hypothetical protein
MVPSLSQINPIHTTPSYLSKIHFNIIHPHMSWSSQWSLSFWLSHHYPTFIRLLPHSSCLPCSSHPPSLDHSNHIWWRVQVMRLLMGIHNSKYNLYLHIHQRTSRQVKRNYTLL